MFERFTPETKSAITHAQAYAALFNSDGVGDEHLLLGLHDGVPESTAARTLRALDLSSKQVRSILWKTASSEPRLFNRGYPIPYTPKAKKTLELALREALQLGHSYIGTEHLLLALLRGGPAVELLIKVGITPGSVRRQVIEMTTKSPEQRLRSILGSAIQELTMSGGVRHDIVLRALTQLLRLGESGNPETEEVLRMLCGVYTATCLAAGRPKDDIEDEISAMLGVADRNSKPQSEVDKLRGRVAELEKIVEELRKSE